ncbi:hypothetical protein PAXRUDRAFT_831716 [Paxillus rubicundulus Ve08.2h10]|uniref:Uncharacterized protein n=1 Tax=Paxillus rubicundulus Ve08.2h10 TaxID=930991 RepID=A0A0D0D1U0_9AGAM|nr:hypothetical protein PAXRUDRAFT_831716 [Paxillus rubicundulus Ve08.2h10]
MSSTFTPSQAIDMSKEKDWPMNLGMMDWDNTKIVFTKRSLVEFLKYTGVTVDPGFTNIQKLPRYTQFGTMTTSSVSEEMATATVTSFTSEVQPSASPAVERLLGGEFADDALSGAPPPPTTHSAEAGGFRPTRRVRTTPGGTSSMGSLFSDDPEHFVPTRRVRQRPGGEDNIEGLF